MDPKLKRLLKPFLYKAVGLFVVWQVMYHLVIVPDGRANQWLTEKVVIGTKLGLNLFGYDTSHNWTNHFDGDTSRYVFIDNEPVVLVGDPCNGLELMALFMGFIIAFPGSWKFKSIFLPLGSIFIFFINVIREVILALNYKYFQETFDFNHKYTYVFIVYSFIFLIWRYWLNNYSVIAEKSR